MFQGLTGSLSRACQKMPTPEAMHPYERELVELTLEGGVLEYTQKTRAIQKLVNRIRDMNDQYCKAVSDARNRVLKMQMCGEGLAAMQELFESQAHRLDEYAALLKQLKRLHVINPRARTAVMVGAPNVGKSSLVRALSSGKPEVQNYSFTTRGVLRGRMGSLAQRGADGQSVMLWQVTDTPGLLHRVEDSARNEIEELTLLALTHLERAVVVFVVDPSGHCGYDLKMQMALRAQIRSKFPRHRWVDVWTKLDLLSGAERSRAKVEARALSSESEEGGEEKEEGDVYEPWPCSTLSQDETHSDGRGYAQNEGGGEGADGTGVKKVHMALDRELMKC
jgi:nucleolar GTP-binding protein